MTIKWDDTYYEGGMTIKWDDTFYEGGRRRHLPELCLLMAFSISRAAKACGMSIVESKSIKGINY
jgi:hypothetical protein